MRLPLKSVARFARQMSTYQDSFVDIRKALESLARGARSLRMRRSLERVRSRIIEGDTLFEAFESEGDRYPEIFLRMTKVGEESGTLAAVYREVAEYLEHQLMMRRRFLMRMIYPSFMLAVMILVHGVLKAVRRSMNEYESLNFAALERVFLRTVAIDLLIVGAVLTAFFAVRFLFWGRSLTDALVILTPGLRGPFRKQMLARFCFSLGLMSASAIPLPEAVAESGRATGNAYAAWRLKRASRDLVEGEQLAPTLERTHLFPEDFINVIEVAEESGQLSESLQRVAVHYSEDADMSMQRLVTGLAWGIYLGMMAVMVYNILTVFAQYVNTVSGFAG